MIVTNLREDSAAVLTLLSAGVEIVTQAELIQSEPEMPEFPGLPWNTAEGYWPLVAKTIAAVEKRDDLQGCLVWNSVQPATRALCLAVRKRGLPAMEIDHGCMATYLHGHFESDPGSTHIFCSPEMDQFLRWYGYQGTTYTTGRPWYDLIEQATPTEARSILGGLPLDKPVVLRTTTWTHGMSQWSDHEILVRQAEVAFLRAMKPLRQALDFTLVYSIRQGIGWDAKQVSEDLVTLGHKDVFVTDEHGLGELIPCADVVVSPKGSAAAEAVIMGRPAVILDFRPQLDEWAWQGKGIRACREPEDLAPLLLKILLDEGYCEELRQERKAGALWFNGPGEATQAIAEEVLRLCGR